MATTPGLKTLRGMHCPFFTLRDIPICSKPSPLQAQHQISCAYHHQHLARSVKAQMTPVNNRLGPLANSEHLLSGLR